MSRSQQPRTITAPRRWRLHALIILALCLQGIGLAVHGVQHLGELLEQEQASSNSLSKAGQAFHEHQSDSDSESHSHSAPGHTAGDACLYCLGLENSGSAPGCLSNSTPDAPTIVRAMAAAAPEPSPPAHRLAFARGPPRLHVQLA